MSRGIGLRRGPSSDFWSKACAVFPTWLSLLYCKAHWSTWDITFHLEKCPTLTPRRGEWHTTQVSWNNPASLRPQLTVGSATFARVILGCRREQVSRGASQKAVFFHSVCLSSCLQVPAFWLLPRLPLVTEFDLRIMNWKKPLPPWVALITMFSTPIKTPQHFLSRKHLCSWQCLWSF